MKVWMIVLSGDPGLQRRKAWEVPGSPNPLVQLLNLCLQLLGSLWSRPDEGLQGDTLHPFWSSRLCSLPWGQHGQVENLIQSSKLPEFQKFFGGRYRSQPVCCKVPSFQSSRSFLVADTDLCLSVSKFQVTRVPEVFWLQIPISACLLQSSQVTRVPEVF